LRWALGLLLSAVAPVHLGTLAANLIGGYLVGVAVAIFTHNSLVAPEWRLLIITGFCGGLTTFSAFSAEIASLLQQGRLGAMAAGIVLHVGGSLAMTLLGIASIRWLSAQH
jgi:CrcB protein